MKARVLGFGLWTKPLRLFPDFLKSRITGVYAAAANAKKRLSSDVWSAIKAELSMAFLRIKARNSRTLIAG